MAGLYLSAITGALPWARSRHGGHPPDAVPEPVRLAGMRFEPARLAAYRQVCGFSGDQLPVTAPQVLALPVQLLLMTDPLFPFPALGVIHIGNTITALRPLDPAEPLDLTVTCGPPKPHPRGRQLTLRTDAEIAGERVWQADTVMLSRGRPFTGSGEQAAAEDARTSEQRLLPDDAPTGPQVWRLPSNLGRTYASVSGDRNPIHLFDLTAKPFGFSHHIAHGMWTKARCIAALHNRLPDAFEVTVSFRKPITLPGKLRFGARTEGSTIDFGVTSERGSAHLVGRVEPVRPD
jgi:acyl dehydratase